MLAVLLKRNYSATAMPAPHAKGMATLVGLNPTRPSIPYQHFRAVLGIPFHKQEEVSSVQNKH